MADRLSSNITRAPRTRSEAAPRAGRRPAKSIMTDRDLAELEAQLTGDLQHAKSPPLAAEDTGGDESDAAPHEARPVRRPAPPRRPPLRPGRAWNDNPAHPRDLDADLRNWRAPPEHRPVPIGALHRPDPHALLSRAMRVTATVFSVIALVGVSALLVLLAAGADRAAAPYAENLLRLAQLAVAPPAPAPVSTQPVQADPTAVTGSIEKPEASRIPDRAAAPRGGGIVTAADTQPQAETALTPQTPDASVVFSPPADRGAPLAEAAASPPDPAPAPEAPAAPVEVASAADSPPAAARNAPVTTHVNMRASPDNDAAVVAVVPAGRNVGVVECTRWCEVAYDGKQGFIHKRFLKE